MGTNAAIVGRSVDSSHESVRDGFGRATLRVRLAEEAYLRCLRVLGAWWCLGSAALEPGLLLARVPQPVPTRRGAAA